MIGTFDCYNLVLTKTTSQEFADGFGLAQIIAFKCEEWHASKWSFWEQDFSKMYTVIDFTVSKTKMAHKPPHQKKNVVLQLQCRPLNLDQ